MALQFKRVDPPPPQQLQQQQQQQPQAPSYLNGGTIQMAKIVLVEELAQKQNKHSFVGTTVRVLASLDGMDFVNNKAMLSYKGKSISADFSLMDLSIPTKIGSNYFFIGDIQQNGDELLLMARLAISAEHLDLNLFEKSLAMRRDFLSKMT